ncbi:MAG: STAS/SEC14 domain-containing protein [Betaproteobacteria bacterium]|nr:STAS/SEC14 domain-containing protein [Betaproteobacteria bacterium]
MSATTTYLPDPGIIEIRFTGATSGNDLARSTIEGIGLAREHRTRRVLVDTTGMTLTASLVDVVKLPTDQYVAEHVDTRTRIALVCPPGAPAREAVQYYEDSCVIHGFDVRTFPDRASALAWLEAGSAPFR